MKIILIRIKNKLDQWFDGNKSLRALLFFSVIAGLLVFFRKPETLLHAQLWAEDGKVWFAQAHNLGPLKSLLISDGGYFQTFSRLVAGLGTFFPLAKVPLLFNSAEFLLQMLPAIFLLTPRFKQLMPSTAARLLLACMYLLLPNTAEMDGHLTSSQWYLAVLAFLVLIASSNAVSFKWKIFDYSVLILSGLTGTFSIFLAPLAFLFWYAKRDEKSKTNFFILLASASVQALSLFVLSHEDRIHVLPALTFQSAFAIYTRQVIWGVLAGAKGYLYLLQNLPWALWVFSGVSVLALGLIFYALMRAPLVLKLFIVFGFMIFFASLITPTKQALSFPILKVFSRSTDGIRYWFIPMLGFVSVLVWGLSRSNPKAVRALAACFFVVSVFGIIQDFRHLPYPETGYLESLKIFQSLPIGAKAVIPITPPGWTMELVKHK